MNEQADLALGDALAFAESIIDTMRDPLLVLDAGLRVVTAGREFYRTFGVKREETEGRLVYELGNRQWDIPGLRTLLEEILPQHATFRDFEVEHVFENIGRKVMLLNARKLYREQNKTERILLVIEDVTERRDAEEARREAETRFTEMVKNVRDHSIFLTDPDGVITSWNVAAERVLGYTEAEALGKPFSFIFTPEDLQNGLPEWELSTAREQGRAEDERWHVKKDGTHFWAMGVVTSLHDAGGRLTGFSKILRDITERKRADEELRENEAWLRGQREALEAALNGAPLEASLGALVRTATEALGEGTRAAFYLADADGKSLRHVVGMGAEYAEAMDGFAIGHESLACGLAMHTGEPVLTTDVMTEPRWESWRWMAERFDYRGCWSFPVHTSTGRFVGTFAVYSRQPREAMRRDLELASFLTHTASIILSRHRESEARGRAEEALREREERTRQLVALMPAAVYTCDAEGRLTFYNRRAAELWGREPRLGDDHERFCGSLRMWTPDGLPVTHGQCPMADAVREGRSARGLEVVVERPDGSGVVVSVNIDPLRDREGRPAGAINVFEDVTERKRAEVAVRESEKRLQLALRAARMGTWTLDLETGAHTRDASLNRLLGLEPAETSQPFDKFLGHVHPEDVPSVRAAFEASMREGRPLNVEFRVVRPDGEVRWLRDQGDVFGDAAAGSRHMAGACVDVTDRRATEEALRASEERQRQTLAGATDFAILTLDAGRRVTSWSPGAAAVFGWAESEMLGRFGDELFTPEDRAARAPERETDKARREGRAADERWHVKNGGQRFYASGVMTPLADGGFVKVLRDLTDRKRMEDELRQQAEALREADRRKDEFLAMLGHELRNPLAPLRGIMETLQRQKLDGDGLGRAYAMMDRQVGHLTHLVDDLLDVSRITRGLVEIRKEPVNIGDVADQAVEMANPAVEGRGHELSFTLPRKGLRVEGDATRLTQVFFNLLNNAAKYTDPGGKIWLTVEREGEEAVVRVRDNGSGMKADFVPRVFDLFTQGERGLDRSQGGLGLGLSLVKRLVDVHGGTVEAKSEGPGKGSEFTVRLPAHPAEAEKAPPARVLGPPQAKVQAGRALVIDDNFDVAEAMTWMLEGLAREIKMVYSGPAALALVRDWRPDLIMCDIGMPGMDGYETCRRLRQAPGLDKVLLAAVSGYGGEEDRRRSQEAGFDRHLVKPVGRAVLEELVMSAAAGG